MDWSHQLINITQIPETLDEAVNWLMTVLDNEQKLIIATMLEDELIDLHFSLGVAIRNSFELHNLNSPLLRSCGNSVHPDDASMVIINVLWKKIRV